MRRLPGRAALLLSILACGAAACGPDLAPQPPEPSQQREALGVAPDTIVVLRPQLDLHDHVRNLDLAARVARSLGITPRRTFGTALLGFSGPAGPAQLARLHTDPRVAYVTRDRPISLVQAPPAPPAGPQDTPPIAPGPPAGAPGGPPIAPDGPAQEPAAEAPANAEPQPDDPAADVAAGAGETTPWGVSRIGALKVANEGVGVHVYVIDTGIDIDHPELIGKIGMGFAAVRCQGTCSAPWDDDNGHGTHVSGTIAAAKNGRGVVGIAPGATLHPVKVLASNGSGDWSGVVAGIDFAALDTRARNRPSVANMSLGGGIDANWQIGTCSDAGYVGQDPLHQAICNARRVGVVFAVAAGNDGQNARFFVPAAYEDTVITASATQTPDDWPPWSNYGTAVSALVPTASAPVALAAPGVNILSTWPGGLYAFASGTSMASPHVAGALALYLSGHMLPPGGAAYGMARTALLGNAVSTAQFGNTSGRTHAERFLDVSRF
jgi:subtilisin